MPTAPRIARRPHSNRADDGLLETHLQTQQKLEIMLRYWEVWCSILVQATGHAFCVASLWMIDCFAGRGVHLSNSHPDGARAGTPLQAYRAAVQTRRRTKRATVHVRASEIDQRVALELQRRLLRAAPPDAGLVPDWLVMPESYTTAMDKILAEMAADHRHVHSSGPRYGHHDHRSLWLVDPDGLRDIPHAALEPLEQLRGAEVIINLDLGGLLRVKGAAEVALGEGDPSAFLAAIQKANERRLDLTWGSGGWREAIRTADPRDILGSVAKAYAGTFRGFDRRRAYPLRGSRSQKRYMIHLSHSERAEEAFEGIWRACFPIDTFLAGDQLSESARASRAVAMHGQFKGTTTYVHELYDLGLGASRLQLRAICRSAQDGGYGEYDEQRDLMTWLAERLPQPTLDLFGEEPPVADAE